MPGPLLLPLLSLGAGIAQQGANMAFQSASNKRQERYNWRMYMQQRQDALSDWNMQNVYNSPAQQMSRLKEAGLNPNLVYGSGVNQQAPAVRSSQGGNYRPIPPQVDMSFVGQSIDQMYNLKYRDAMTENVKAQTRVAQMEAANKALVGANLATTGELSKFELEMRKDLKENRLALATEELRKLRQDIIVQFDRNEREALSNKQHLAIGLETILNMRQGRIKTQAEINQIRESIENLKRSGQLQDLEIQLRKKGVQPGDRIWERALLKIWNWAQDKLKGDSDSLIPGFWDWLF